MAGGALQQELGCLERPCGLQWSLASGRGSYDFMAESPWLNHDGSFWKTVRKNKENKACKTLSYYPW